MTLIVSREQLMTLIDAFLDNDWFVTGIAPTSGRTYALTVCYRIDEEADAE